MSYLSKSYFDDDLARARLEAWSLDLEGIEAKRSELNATERRIRADVDAMRLEAKPTYPLPEHITGLDEAVERVKRKVHASCHLGDPCGPDTNHYCVVADGARGFVSVRHLAPYTARRSGSKLWDFTEADIEAFKGLLRDLGATHFISDWPHDEGHSFIIKTGE